MNQMKNGISQMQKGEMMPKEEMLEIRKKRKSLTIAIPRENTFQENRVALVPDSVGLVVQNGHKVIVEKEAGKLAFFMDKDYSENGAILAYTKEELYKADIILKTAPLSQEEIQMLKGRQTVISTVHYGMHKATYFKELMEKKIIGIGFEYIKDKTKNYPIVRSMSEISGNTAVLIAAEYLSNPKYGKRKMLGGISGVTPTEVVILGAGTVGEYATRAALGLGASVRIFDNSIYKLRRLQENVNNRLYTSILQPKVLLKALKSADVVIAALHSYDGMPKFLVTEEQVQQMKKGAIIVDVSIDQGGCFETSKPTTHNNPVFQKHGITHYCVANIASRVAQTASYALSNFFTNILLEMGEAGGVENLLIHDSGLRKGVYIYNGILTNEHIGNYHNISFQDIDLLMAAFR